jgi:hypothetical protein
MITSAHKKIIKRERMPFPLSHILFKKRVKSEKLLVLATRDGQRAKIGSGRFVVWT